MWQRHLGRREILQGAAASLAALGWGAQSRRMAAAGSRMPPQASPSPAFDHMFAAYGNNTDPRIVRWTGGDGAYSIRLPDGRTVWIFSDTFLGTVYWDSVHQCYARTPGSPSIHNCYVLQDAASMTLSATLYGGTPSSPTALVNPSPADGSWYWMGDATIEGTTLRQFVPRFVSTGQGMWAFAQIATDIASFALPSLTALGVLPAPVQNGCPVAYYTLPTGYAVSFGAAIYEQPPYTYVYGVEDGGLNKWYHLARLSGGVFGTWTYWTGAAWSTDPLQSARLLSTSGRSVPDGASQAGVTRQSSGAYAMIYQQYSLSQDIVLSTAASPTGPWTPPGIVYVCPEDQTTLYTYNAVSHPEFCANGNMLLTYCVNSQTVAGLFANVNNYRPRFLSLAIC